MQRTLQTPNNVSILYCSSHFEILTIDQLIVHRIGTVMYKFNYGLLPDVLSTMYRKKCEIHSYNTRSKDMFGFHLVRKHFQTSVLEFGILLW